MDWNCLSCLIVMYRFNKARSSKEHKIKHWQDKINMAEQALANTPIPQLCKTLCHEHFIDLKKHLGPEQLKEYNEFIDRVDAAIKADLMKQLKPAGGKQ